MIPVSPGLNTGIASRYAKRFNGGRVYSHLDAQFGRDRVIDEIAEQYEQSGAPVILIGHSWGGPEVYRLAADLEERGVFVPIYTMADSVGRWRPDQPPHLEHG